MKRVILAAFIVVLFGMSILPNSVQALSCNPKVLEMCYGKCQDLFKDPLGLSGCYAGCLIGCATSGHS